MKPMCKIRLAAGVAGLCLAAGAASAATFEDDYLILAGTSQTFSYAFSEAFTGGLAVMVDTGWYEYRNTDFGPNFVDAEHDTVQIDCGLTASCVATGYAVYSGGGGLKLKVTPTAFGFDLLAENTLKTVQDCPAGIPNRRVCGSRFGESAFLQILGATDGRYTVTVTSNAVPEPATWAMMIAGFGLMGATLRRQRIATT